jgi:hypothetical protein
MKKNISFIKVKKDIPDIYQPIPASKDIPSWYKDLSSYITENKVGLPDGYTASTAKKCMPLFDSISSGYLIKTYCDIQITWDGLAYEFLTPNSYTDTISFHGIVQLPNHPSLDEFHTAVAKFINGWAIKTDPGYSSIFLPPMHRDNILSIAPGIVDTDVFTDAVNLPFFISKPGFTGIVPAGTPIAQVIPIKRDSWTSSFSDDDSGPKKDSMAVRSMFFEAYKKLMWSKKDYR